MTPTPVGMRCPECARQRTKVRRGPAAYSTVPQLTYVLIAINVIVWLAEGSTGSSLAGGTGGGTVFTKGALFGPLIAHSHEYWRLLTAGFLHLGFLHLLFNMIFLYVMGPMLEQAIGRLNFTAVYFASLFAGSFGALLFQPDVPTVGASGAAFGVLGALMAFARARRISIWQSGLGPTLAVNVVLGLTFKGISIGGHVGGFVGGLICGWLIAELGERRRLAGVALAGCAVVAVASVAAAIAVAGGAGIAPNGFGFGA
jgi:membrane associated rhomboid family serine protease